MHNTQLQPHTTRLLGDGEDLHQTLILQQIARGGRQAEEKVVLQLADAAARTGLSESAVKVTVHRAIKSLGEDLGERDADR